MNPTTIPLSLSILFLLLILLPTTQAQLDQGLDDWSHTQIQSGTGQCLIGKPVIEASGGGEFVAIHEKGCWTGSGTEAFRTTNLQTFSSIGTDTGIGEGQYKQLHYNTIDNEFYSCIRSDDDTVTHFMFWQDDGTPLHTGDSNSALTGIGSTINHCGIAHTSNSPGNYNTITCRYSSAGSTSNEFQWFRALYDYGDTTFSELINTESNSTHRCSSVGLDQLIVEVSPRTDNQNQTQWTYNSLTQRGVRERECIWHAETGVQDCDSVSQREVFPTRGGITTGFAATQLDGTILYATASDHFGTHPDTGDPAPLSKIQVHTSRWGSANGQHQTILNIEDVTSNKFGFIHQLQNPCVWWRDNVMLLAYTAWDREEDIFYTVAHASFNSGNSWGGPSIVQSSVNINSGSPQLNRHGNCIAYDASLDQVAISSIVNNADVTGDGGAWVSYTDLSSLNITAGLDAINLPDGTVSDGTTFFGAPLTPVANSWNIPLTAVQWLVGLIVVMLLIASVAYLGLIAIVLVIIVGIAWAFVLGMFPLWFLLIIGLLLSLGVGVSIFGGRE